MHTAKIDYKQTLDTLEIKKNAEKKHKKKVNEAVIEGLNWATHFFMFVLLIPCGIYLLLKSDSLIMFATNLVFAVANCVLFLSSANLHIFYWIKSKLLVKILNVLDHCAISIIIPSCYTPLCWNFLRNCWVGMLIFAIVWILGISTILVNIFLSPHFWRTEIVLYLSMGWLMLPIIPLFVNEMPIGGVLFIVCGGVFYTGGVVFYILGRKFYSMHIVWHIFVNLGGACIYACVYFYDYPKENFKNYFCWVNIFSM